MLKFALIAFSIALSSTSVRADEGLIVLPAAHAPKASLDKLESIAKERGMTIFARIDHEAGAESVGEILRPTEVLIFGHPKAGTVLMKCTQTFGIDLPMRVLAWQDEAGKNWMAYKDLATLGHTFSQPFCNMAVKRITSKLDELVKEAAAE